MIYTDEKNTDDDMDEFLKSTNNYLLYLDVYIYEHDKVDII